MYNTVLLTQGDFVPLLGDIRQCRETFLVVTNVGALGIWCIKARDARSKIVSEVAQGTN